MKDIIMSAAAGSDTVAPAKCTGKDESSSGRKAKPPEEAALKCPRCDSSNTKFCYYNNYSLSQPRHLCKTCRRYWTRGGALRNVPIGGGCRKTKKIIIKSDSIGSSSDHVGAGFKLFHDQAAAMDFQLSTYGGLNNFPANSTNQYLSSRIIRGDVSINPCDPIMMGLMNFAALSSSSNVNSNQALQLTSSIETLSSINQDLHWKLQQQRLMGTLFVDQQDRHINTSRKESSYCANLPKPEALLGQDGIGSTANLSTDQWFFDNAPVNIANEASWSNMNQYSAFP